MGRSGFNVKELQRPGSDVVSSFIGWSSACRTGPGSEVPYWLIQLLLILISNPPGCKPVGTRTKVIVVLCAAGRGPDRGRPGGGPQRWYRALQDGGGVQRDPLR